MRIDRNAKEVLRATMLQSQSHFKFHFLLSLLDRVSPWPPDLSAVVLSFLFPVIKKITASHGNIEFFPIEYLPTMGPPLLFFIGILSSYDSLGNADSLLFMSMREVFPLWQMKPESNWLRLLDRKMIIGVEEIRT